MAQQSIGLVRQKYLSELQKHTDRNIIAYYSGWLSKQPLFGMEINDEDKNGFMMAVHKLDRKKGLDSDLTHARRRHRVNTINCLLSPKNV